MNEKSLRKIYVAFFSLGTVPRVGGLFFYEIYR